MHEMDQVLRSSEYRSVFAREQSLQRHFNFVIFFIRGVFFVHDLNNFWGPCFFYDTSGHERSTLLSMISFGAIRIAHVMSFTLCPLASGLTFCLHCHSLSLEKNRIEMFNFCLVLKFINLGFAHFIIITVRVIKTFRGGIPLIQKEEALLELSEVMIITSSHGCLGWSAHGCTCDGFWAVFEGFSQQEGVLSLRVWVT
ncbi:hypothetical protein BDZ97DRAFT_135627 [Flammula alnicola]|nr:hypothetical protein BDZ97DRAFT_135627 [Flammula alnicola]